MFRVFKLKTIAKCVGFFRKDMDNDKIPDVNIKTITESDAAHPRFVKPLTQSELKEYEFNNFYYCEFCKAYFDPSLEGADYHFTQPMVKHVGYSPCLFCLTPVYMYKYKGEKKFYHNCVKDSEEIQRLMEVDLEKRQAEVRQEQELEELRQLLLQRRQQGQLQQEQQQQEQQQQEQQQLDQQNQDLIQNLDQNQQQEQTIL